MRLLGKSCFAMTLAFLSSATSIIEGANPRGGTTLPVMTALTVKLDETVNPKTAPNGSGFTASIKEPVQIDGVTVIPANASAAGLVNRESPNTGELELNSIFVNGRMYRVTTSPISFNQKTNLRAGSTMTFHLVLSLNVGR
jgi:hypothetical protein